MDAKAPPRRSLDDVVPAGRTLAPGKFAHIVFTTQNVPRLRDWYATFLNASVVTGNDQLGCFMSFDDEHHRLAITHDPHAKPRSGETVGVAHFAYSYRNLGELLHTYRRLKKEGILPFWSINHGMTTSFYYHDPDNNVVEIQVDVFPTGDAAKAWMQREIPTNPIGIAFDPEEMIANYEAGVPVEELVYRRDLKPGETFFDHLPGKHPAKTR